MYWKKNTILQLKLYVFATLKIWHNMVEQQANQATNRKLEAACLLFIYID
jgi:hypothetical protein